MKSFRHYFKTKTGMVMFCIYALCVIVLVLVGSTSIALILEAAVLLGKTLFDWANKED